MITEAIIPAAGIGSRFLPLTKELPKELLPVYDKPCIQHVIEEGVASGITKFIIVISPEKEMIASYFKPNEQLNDWLGAKGLIADLKILRDLETMAEFHFVYQDKPLGLGHAVMCGQQHIDGDHFFVILPDDIMDSDVPVCQQLQDVFAEQQRPILSVVEVSWNDVHRFGIVQADPFSEYLGDVMAIIEKPGRSEAPSNLAVMGRYVLPKSIFSSLEKLNPGAQSEIQLTDALQKLVKETGLTSYLFQGERFDAGTPVGLLKASLAASLRSDTDREKISQTLKLLSGL